jgi:hypothetical protein
MFNSSSWQPERSPAIYVKPVRPALVEGPFSLAGRRKEDGASTNAARTGEWIGAFELTAA